MVSGAIGIDDMTTKFPVPVAEQGIFYFQACFWRIFAKNLDMESKC